MQSFKTYIKQFPHYTPEAFDAVLPHLSKKEIKAGDYFLREGKICRHVAFVKSGLVRLFYLHDGKEVTNCFCKENTITTSYTSMITQQESEIIIQAIEDTSLIVLPYTDLLKLYEQSLFWQQLGRLAAENEFIITESYNRLIRDKVALDRYLHIMKNESDLIQRVPLNVLATYLQVTPETVSRIRNKVAKLDIDQV